MFDCLQHYYRSERLNEVYLHAQLNAEERYRREQEKCRRQELRRNRSFEARVPETCMCCYKA